MEIRKRFNLIGFRDFDRPNFAYDDYLHCAIHSGVRCFPDPKEENMMICPLCGLSYKKNETVKEQNIQSKFDPKSSTKIIQPKKKRNHYDNFGTLIPEDDIDAIQDMQGGRTIVYYHEQKAEENKDKVVSLGKYGKIRWSDLM